MIACSGSLIGPPGDIPDCRVEVVTDSGETSWLLQEEEVAMVGDRRINLMKEVLVPLSH